MVLLISTYLYLTFKLTCLKNKIPLIFRLKVWKQIYEFMLDVFNNYLISDQINN